MAEIRGYGTGDTKALMLGWTTVAPDIRVKLFDDAVSYIIKTRGLTGSSVKIKNVSIDIPPKNTDDNGKRTVTLKAKVDMVLLGYYGSGNYKIVISRKSGDTTIPENIIYSNRPGITPIVLLKDETYVFLIDTGGEEASATDLLLSGVQIGELPTDLGQYDITDDTGTEISA